MSKYGKSKLNCLHRDHPPAKSDHASVGVKSIFRGNSNHNFLKVTTKKHRRLFRKIFNLDFNFRNTLTLTRPLRTKVRMCRNFDDSKVLNSTFSHSDFMRAQRMSNFRSADCGRALWTGT